jgi:hypothetical protein
MRNIATAIALAIALPAAAYAAPAAKADDGKAMSMNCMSQMKGHDMSKMDMKGTDMKGMDMKGHDMAGMDMQGHDMMMKMQSCKDAAQIGASTTQDVHPIHAR